MGERKDARLLMAKCKPRKMRFVGITSHYRAPSRGVSAALLPTARHVRETHADKRRDSRNAEHIMSYEHTDTNRIQRELPLTTSACRSQSCRA